MNEDVVVKQIADKPRLFFVRLPHLHGDDAIAFVIEKWDHTDDEAYWCCLRHRSAACPCVVAVKRKTLEKDKA